jgi:nicotinamide-nucleotide amidase
MFNNIFNQSKMLDLQNLLIEKNQTITCAESCTGGLVASYITQNSGSSSIFKGSIVTYCNEIKEQELDVKKETMIKYGVVSCEVVEQMCRGALKKFDANYAIAISGVAGPSGGTKNKPVGTVAIGIMGTNNTQDIRIYNFKGNRNEIQIQAAKTALNTIFYFYILLILPQ